jgi:Protein kinase domain/PDZ domain
MNNPQSPAASSEVTLREAATSCPTTTPGSEATLIETPDAASPAAVVLTAGFEIDGWWLRETIKVTSGEADLWVATGKDSQTAVVKVFRWGLRPKSEIEAKLLKVSRAQVVEVYGRGVLPDGRHYEVLEHIRHGTLADLGKGGLPQSRVKEVLKELADAVEALHEVGILHRDLKPANVLVRTVEPLDLVLTDFGISSLAELSLHATSAHRTAAYSAPEAMTGVVSRASDWWSVGVMVLELLRGAHPFAGLDERAVNFQLVTRGIEVPSDLASDWALLVKGLLTRDHAKRWGAEQVRGWLEGKRNQTVHYTAAAAAVIGQKPYRFQGQEYGDAASLAVALAEHWEEGVKHWGRGYVLQWIEKDLSDQDLASQLHDVQDDKGLPTAELQLAVAVLAMNPELPLSWHGEVVSRDWLALHLQDAKTMLASTLPAWLERMRKETWLKELTERKARWRHEAGSLPVNDETLLSAVLASEEALLESAGEIQREYYNSSNKALDSLLGKKGLKPFEAAVLAAVPVTLFVSRAEVAEKRVDEFLRKANALKAHTLVPSKGRGISVLAYNEAQEALDQTLQEARSIESALEKIFGPSPVPRRLGEQLDQAVRDLQGRREARLQAFRQAREAELLSQWDKLQREATNISFPTSRHDLQNGLSRISRLATDIERELEAVFGSKEVSRSLVEQKGKATNEAKSRLEGLLAEHAQLAEEVASKLPELISRGELTVARQRLAEIKQRFSDIDCRALEQSLAEWEAFYGDLDEKLKPLEQRVSDIPGLSIWDLPWQLGRYLKQRQAVLVSAAEMESELGRRRAVLEQEQYRGTQFYYMAQKAFSMSEQRLAHVRGQFAAAYRRATIAGTLVAVALMLMLCLAGVWMSAVNRAMNTPAASTVSSGPPKAESAAANSPAEGAESTRAADVVSARQGMDLKSARPVRKVPLRPIPIPSLGLTVELALTNAPVTSGDSATAKGYFAVRDVKGGSIAEKAGLVQGTILFGLSLLKDGSFLIEFGNSGLEVQMATNYVSVVKLKENGTAFQAGLKQGDSIETWDASETGEILLRVASVPLQVSDVYSPSAITAGLKRDDRILSVDGQQVYSWGQLASLVTNSPNSKVRLAVQRGATVLDIDVPAIPDTNGIPRIGIVQSNRLVRLKLGSPR